MTKLLFEEKWIKEIQDDLSRKYFISLRILGSKQFLEAVADIPTGEAEAEEYVRDRLKSDPKWLRGMYATEWSNCSSYVEYLDRIEDEEARASLNSKTRTFLYRLKGYRAMAAAFNNVDDASECSALIDIPISPFGVMEGFIPLIFTGELRGVLLAGHYFVKEHGVLDHFERVKEDIRIGLGVSDDFWSLREQTIHRYAHETVEAKSREEFHETCQDVMGLVNELFEYLRQERITDIPYSDFREVTRLCGYYHEVRKELRMAMLEIKRLASSYEPEIDPERLSITFCLNDIFYNKPRGWGRGRFVCSSFNLKGLPYFFEFEKGPETEPSMVRSAELGREDVECDPCISSLWEKVNGGLNKGYVFHKRHMRGTKKKYYGAMILGYASEEVLSSLGSVLEPYVGQIVRHIDTQVTKDDLLFYASGQTWNSSEMVKIKERLNTSSDYEKIICEMLDETVRHVDGTFAGYYRIDAVEEQLIPVVFRSIEHEQTDINPVFKSHQISLSSENSILVKAVRTRMAQTIRGDEITPETFVAVDFGKVSFCTSVPIIVDRKVSAVFFVAAREDIHFGRRKKAFLFAIRSILSPAIRNNYLIGKRQEMRKMLPKEKDFVDASNTLLEMTKMSCDVIGCSAAAIWLFGDDKCLVLDKYYPNKPELFNHPELNGALPQDSLSNLAVEKGEPVEAHDLPPSFVYTEEYEGKIYTFHSLPFHDVLQTKSFLATPISLGADRLGTINLYSKKRVDFPEREKAFMRGLAMFCASVIQQAKRNREEIIDKINNERLLRLAIDINSSMDLDVIFARILDEALFLAKSDEGIIRIKNKDSMLVVGCEKLATERKKVRKDRLSIGEGITGKCVEIGATIIENDIPNSKFASNCPGVKSEIAVPIMINNEPVGAINVENNNKLNHFGDYYQGVLEVLAGLAATAIRNAELFKRINILHDLTLALSEVKDVEDLAKNIVDLSRDLLGANISILYRYDMRDHAFKPKSSKCAGTFEKCAASACVDSLNCDLIKNALPRKDGLGQHALKTGKHVISRNGKEIHEAMWSDGIRVVAAFPLQHDIKTFGLLYLTSCNESFLKNKEDVKLAEIFSNYMSVVYYNSDLYKSRVEALSAINHKLASTNNFQELFEAILQESMQLTGASMGTLTLIVPEKNGKKLQIVSARGAKEESIGYKYLLSEGVTGWVVSQNEDEIIVRNPRTDEKFKDKFIALANDETRSELIATIREGAKIIGVINLESPNEDAFYDEQLPLIRSIAEQASIAIKEAKLHAILKQQEGELRKAFDKRLHAARVDAIRFTTHKFNGLMGKLKIEREYMHEAITDNGCDRIKIAKCLEASEKHHAEMAKVNEKLWSDVFGQNQMQSINLNALIGKVIKDRRALNSPQSLNMKMDYDTSGLKEVPEIEMNRDMLEMVIDEIVGNAEKAVSDYVKGKIAVRSAIIVDSENRELIEITIEDNGKGIDEKFRKKVFDEDFTLWGEALGGKGLFLCRSFIEQSGGRIDMQSKPGAGTTVIVTLPLKGEHYE